MRACKPTGPLEVGSMSHQLAPRSKPGGTHLQAPYTQSLPAVSYEKGPLKLNLLAGEVCVSKFLSIDVSCWFERSGVLAAIFEGNQISLIHEENKLLRERAVAHEAGWRVLQIDGILDFAISGVLYRILTPLAKVGVGVLVVSSFDTDYILVKKEHLFAVTSCLMEHHIRVHRRGRKIC